MTHSTKRFIADDSSLFGTIVDEVRSVKRPSTASVTTILPLQDLIVWRSKWLAGHTLTDDDFRALKPSQIASVRNGTTRFIQPSNAAEWASATSLNPKPISHPRVNYRVWRVANLFPDAFIRVVKKRSSSSVSFYICDSDLQYLDRVKKVLSNIHQHVLIGVVD